MLILLKLVYCSLNVERHNININITRVAAFMKFKSCTFDGVLTVGLNSSNLLEFK